MKTRRCAVGVIIAVAFAFGRALYVPPGYETVDYDTVPLLPTEQYNPPILEIREVMASEIPFDNRTARPAMFDMSFDANGSVTEIHLYFFADVEEEPWVTPRHIRRRLLPGERKRRRLFDGRKKADVYAIRFAGHRAARRSRPGLRVPLRVVLARDRSPGRILPRRLSDQTRPNGTVARQTRLSLGAIRFRVGNPDAERATPSPGRRYRWAEISVYPVLSGDADANGSLVGNGHYRSRIWPSAVPLRHRSADLPSPAVPGHFSASMRTARCSGRRCFFAGRRSGRSCLTPPADT